MYTTYIKALPAVPMSTLCGDRLKSVKEEPMQVYPTACPRSLGPIYMVTYDIKWVTTSWTDSIW